MLLFCNIYDMSCGKFDTPIISTLGIVCDNDVLLKSHVINV